MQKIKLENHWNVQSLFEFQYFNCPSCKYKDYVIQNFVYHAFENHPESTEYLSNITDGSLEGILCPWNSNNVYREESNDCGDFGREHWKEEDTDAISIDVKEEFIDNDSCEIDIVENDLDICGNDNNFVENDNNILLADINKPKTWVTSTSFKPPINEKSSADVQGGIQESPNNNKIKCQYCTKTVTKKSMNRHIRNFHKEKIVQAEKIQIKHQCESCGKSFGEAWSLKAHKITVHERQRNYKCNSCEKSFLSKANLKNHMDSHVTKSGERNQKCDSCGKAFSLLKYLKKHIYEYHEGRVSNCEICGKSFSNANNVKKHIKEIHETKDRIKSYKCDKCEKSYFLRINLESHIASVHENRKDYSCDICGNSFTQAYSVKAHKATVHGGKKSPKLWCTCPNCGKYFQKDYLKSHMKKTCIKDYETEVGQKIPTDEDKNPLF